MTRLTPAKFVETPGLGSIASHYDVVLSDIWGVVHDGLKASAQACEALLNFRKSGGTVVLITNAPRPNGPIKQQLIQLGAPEEIFDAVVTSGDVTAALVAERAGQSLYHIGPKHDLPLLDEAAKLMPQPPRMVGLYEADYVLCTGLNHDDVETPADYDSVLFEAKKRGLTMICANPDLVVHRGEKLIYCGGAIGERYKEQGGQTIYAGKPYAPIYAECLHQAQAFRSKAIDKTRVLAIGDALRTDVAGAVAQGLDVLMISNGLHRDEMHAETELHLGKSQQFLAKHAVQPSYLMKNLRW